MDIGYNQLINMNNNANHFQEDPLLIQLKKYKI